MSLQGSKLKTNQYREMIVDLVISGLLPMAAYHYLKYHLHWTEIHALSAVIVFPLIGAVRNLTIVRSVDLISGLSIAGIVISLVAALVGGDPKLLLIRESLLTIILGIASFISLLLPRPLMFYGPRAARPKSDPESLAMLEMKYNRLPALRRGFRVITLAWGICFTLEFALKVLLVYKLSVETVLVVGPIATNTVAMACLGLTFLYVRKVREQIHAAPPPQLPMRFGSQAILEELERRRA